jgi:porphobilinogen synthase
VLLFGIPESKDPEGSGAWDDEGIVQLATRAIKERHPTCS